MAISTSSPIKVIQYNVHLFVGTAGGFAPEYEDELRLSHLITRLNALNADPVDSGAKRNAAMKADVDLLAKLGEEGLDR